MSGPRGAKQLVVERMQRIFSDPNSWILAVMASISVLNSSPSRTFSMMTGSKPATWNRQQNQGQEGHHDDSSKFTASVIPNLQKKTL